MSYKSLRVAKAATLVALIAILSLGLGAAAPSVPTAIAAPTSAGAWSSGFSVMNVDTVDAQVTIKYYQTGTAAQTTQGPITITPGTKHDFNIYNGDLIVDPGFLGSVVVESTAKVAAITNVVSTSPNLLGSYTGVASPSTAYSLPIIMKGNAGFYTVIYVQNAGGSSANVQLQFTKEGDTTPTTTKSYTIAAGAMQVVDQSLMPELGTKWVGSVHITSASPVAAVVNQLNDLNQLYTYTGFPDSVAADTIYAPVVHNNNGGYFTSINVQLVAGTTGDVTLYVNDTPVATRTIAAVGGSAVFYKPVWGSKSGSAYVRGPAGSQLLGVVNQFQPSTNQALSYGMFAQANASNRVIAPLLQNSNAGYTSGFSVQNIGTSPVAWTFWADGVDKTSTVPLAQCPNPLPAKQSCLPYPMSFATSAKTFAGEFRSADGTAKLVGVVNQIRPGFTDGDYSSSYEAINP